MFVAFKVDREKSINIVNELVENDVYVIRTFSSEDLKYEIIECEFNYINIEKFEKHDIMNFRIF